MSEHSLNDAASVLSAPSAGGLKGNLLTKTLLFVGLASVVVATLFIVLTLEITQRRAEEQATARLNEFIDSTGVMASIACFANDATLALETAQAFVKNSDVLSVVISSGKRELARSLRPGSGVALADQHHSAQVTRPVLSPFDPGEKIGEIVVTPNWQEIDRRVAEEVRYSALILVLLATGIVGVIALVVTFLVVRPVKAISDKLHLMDAVAGEALAVPAAHASNELGRLVGDINDLLGRSREQHESHLQRVVSEKLRLAAEVFEHSQEGIMVTDRENRIITVNRAFSQITGYAEGEVVGHDPRILSSGQHDRKFYSGMWDSLLHNGYWKGEMWNRCKSGQVIPKWFSINTVRDETGQIVNHVAIFSDISERKQAEERIEFLAHHDPLTNLPNRLLLRDRFSQASVSALREKTGVTMLFVDLDNFKHVNDSLGHQAGDLLLLAVVERLKKFIRDTDTICRQGGDEFIVILPGISDSEVVTRVTQNMLDAIASPFALDANGACISASIGIALFPTDGADFDSLLRHADAAMYDAKASGKNAYRFFTEEMNSDAAEKMRIKTDLRQALRDGEFVLYYQPQIDLTSGRIVGSEALIRWQHRELGMVPPSHFIPLAEECGLINPIGEWVLAEACRQGCEWLAAGIAPGLLAVNVSALQFNRGNIFETVQAALQKSGYPPELLCIELTESALLNNVEQTLATIGRLKELGVKLAIDDFGTGYSSLSYLKQIKVDKLKIDQSFVRDIGHDAEDLAIVHAIIQLGQTLQLRVIAEGVETAEQFRILQSYGCDEAQGYYFGHPQPFAELSRRLQSEADVVTSGAA